MQRFDGIIVDYNLLDKKGIILVVEDGDFDDAIRFYEKNRLDNLDGKLLYFKYKHLIHSSRFLFKKIPHKRIEKVLVGMPVNFDIDGNPKRPNLVVRITIRYRPKCKVTSLFYFKGSENDRFAKRVGRMNQKVKHNLFKPWVIPFRS